MSLASRCSYAFSDDSAALGSNYFESGRVAVRTVDDGGASAVVDGSATAPYRVALEWPSDGVGRELGVSCSCPHFADGFYCKHIFATILAVDGSAPDRVQAGTRILKVGPIELEHSSAVDVDAAGLQDQALSGDDPLDADGLSTHVFVVVVSFLYVLSPRLRVTRRSSGSARTRASPRPARDRREEFGGSSWVGGTFAFGPTGMGAGISRRAETRAAKARPNRGVGESIGHARRPRFQRGTRDQRRRPRRLTISRYRATSRSRK